MYDKKDNLATEIGEISEYLTQFHDQNIIFVILVDNENNILYSSLDTSYAEEFISRTDLRAYLGHLAPDGYAYHVVKDQMVIFFKDIRSKYIIVVAFNHNTPFSTIEHAFLEISRGLSRII